MNVSTRTRRWLIAALFAALAIWGYQTVDARLLARGCRGTAEQKAQEVVSKTSAKRLAVANVQVTAWRAVPVVGVPSAKVTVTFRYPTSSGSALTTPFDFFLTRKNGKWQEMSPHCNLDHASLGEHNCH